MTSPNVSSNFLVAGLFVSIVFILFPSVSLTVQIVSLGIAVSVLGLPHGARLPDERALGDRRVGRAQSRVAHGPVRGAGHAGQTSMVE